METLKSIDIHSKKTKYALSFVIPFVLFIILSPGTFFEIDPNESKKVKIQRKQKIVTTVIHSVIFSIIMFCIYYFYLSKCKQYAEI